MIRFGLPSKGRLKKQVEKFLFEKGLELVNVGSSREYLAEFKAEKQIQIILLENKTRITVYNRNNRIGLNNLI